MFWTDVFWNLMSSRLTFLISYLYSCSSNKCSNILNLNSICGILWDVQGMTKHQSLNVCSKSCRPWRSCLIGDIVVLVNWCSTPFYWEWFEVIYSELKWQKITLYKKLINEQGLLYQPIHVTGHIFICWNFCSLSFLERLFYLFNFRPG